MKFLIDTNIFIPPEPSSRADVESGTSLMAKFNRWTIENARPSARHQVFIHPITKLDINQDLSEEHRKLRNILLQKYPELPDPPEIPPEFDEILDIAFPNTDEWIRHHLIAALAGNAVDFLVTDDRRIHEKAKRLNLQERVTTLVDAIETLQDFFDFPLTPPPAVKETSANTLNVSDPLFDNLRLDYPGFNNWMNRCKQEELHTWVIEGEDTKLVGLCIIKTENDIFTLRGKVLKICSFKVSENYSGYRFGELLLKKVFAYAEENQYNWIYVTVCKNHNTMAGLFKDFGFRSMDVTTKLGELILVKPLTFSNEDYQKMTPLDFYISFGPYMLKFQDVPTFMVPIHPVYHKILFPETEQQMELIPGLHPYGNAIRKAYLTNSIIHNMAPGSNLVFYRSGDLRLVTALGVVESMLVSSSPTEIARYISKRTVYNYNEIESMCQKKVLAILFRQSRILKNPIPFQELITKGIIKKAPKSIRTIPEEALPWLQQKID
ncbi:MAG TPA: GNAT family N-acetyltransferase [Bacillota bacterium]|nr:GNAT family N-acetyltransferase [Bacillota bacterium]